jgi:hypothetical protein
MTEHAKIIEVMALASCRQVGDSPACRVACGGCKRHMQSALTALQASGMAVVPGWQPIESAPNDGKPHLITGWKGNQEGGARWYATAIREGGEWFPDDPDGAECVAFYPPTHWMCLMPPASPDGKSERPPGSAEAPLGRSEKQPPEGAE